MFEILYNEEKREIYNLYGEAGLTKKKPNQARRKEGVNDITENVEITLADAYNGKTVKFKVERQRLCKDCKDKGDKL